jgi:hypothetical protein
MDSSFISKHASVYNMAFFQKNRLKINGLSLTFQKYKFLSEKKQLLQPCLILCNKARKIIKNLHETPAAYKNPDFAVCTFRFHEAVPLRKK